MIIEQKNSALLADFEKALNKLVELAADDHYNPFKEFDWPAQLSDDQYWMSLDLLSVYNTSYFSELSESQLMVLTKWESINFYSMNVHGIRELLIEVLKRIHMPGFELPSEFFHHFVGEENEHMWFFSKFCLNYGHKIYEDKKFKLADFEQSDIENFLVFCRILIFEEIVDYFNIRMGKDKSLDPIIRKINQIHHQDESRHIAFGREIVKVLHNQLKQTHSPDKLLEVEHYLKRYISASINTFYNPIVYKDAGIPDPYNFRKKVIEDPGRAVYHEKMLKRTLDFFKQNEIFTKGGLEI